MLTGSGRGDKRKDGVAWWNSDARVQRVERFCFAPSKNQLKNQSVQEHFECFTIKLKRLEPNILIEQEPFLLLYYSVKSQLGAGDQTSTYPMDFFFSIIRFWQRANWKHLKIKQGLDQMTADKNWLTALFVKRQWQVFTGQGFCLGCGTGPPRKKKHASFSSENTDGSVMWFSIGLDQHFRLGTGTKPTGWQGEATDPFFLGILLCCKSHCAIWYKP